MTITDSHDLHIVISTVSEKTENADTDYSFVLEKRNVPLVLDKRHEPSPDVPSLISITPTGVVFDGTSPEHRAAFIRSVLRAPGVTPEIAPGLHDDGEWYPEITGALRVWSTQSNGERASSLGVVVLAAAVFGVEELASGRHAIAVARDRVSIDSVVEAIDRGIAWREARRSKLEFWQSHLCPLVTDHKAVPAPPLDPETIARDPTIN